MKNKLLCRIDSSWLLAKLVVALKNNALGPRGKTDDLPGVLADLAAD